MRLALGFDLDGTLVDSLADIRTSMNLALVAAGFRERSHETYRALIGDGIRDLAARASGTSDERVIDRLVADCMAAYEPRLCAQTAPYAGIASMLASLKARGLRLAVLTNKPDAAAQIVVSTLFPGVFDDIRGHVEGTAKKPDPGPLRAQLERLGVVPARALFVGDSEVDVATAKNAGVRALAVTYGYRDREMLGAADEVVSDVESLRSAIDRWLVVMGLPSDQYRAP